jgi:hypothetical protein
MMGTIYWSLTLPLLLGAVQGDLPPGWKVFDSNDRLFTVHMPKAPMEPKKQVVKTATLGELNVTTVIAEGPHDSYFVVSYSDFPSAQLKKGDEAKRLEQACKGAEESSRGNLRDKKQIRLGDRYAGREFVIEKDGAVIAKMRIYLVENRLYQIMVLGKGSIFSSKEKDVGVFMDSFRLNK